MTPTTSYLRWTKRMTEIMLAVLCEEVALRGKRSDNGVEIVSLEAAAMAVNQAVGMSISVDNVKLGLRVLRRDYRCAKALIEASGFGFCFDSGTKIIDADEDSWEHYILAHPEAASLRGRQFPYYEQGHIIFGKETANGDGMYAGELPGEEKYWEDAPGGTEPNFDEDEADFCNPILGDGSASTSQPRVSGKFPSQPSFNRSEVPISERPHKCNKNDDPNLPDFNKSMVDTVKSLASHIAGPSIEDLAGVLFKVLGVDNENAILEPVEVLVHYKSLMKMFMALPRKLQRGWLAKKFGNNGGVNAGGVRSGGVTGAIDDFSDDSWDDSLNDSAV